MNLEIAKPGSRASRAATRGGARQSSAGAQKAPRRRTTRARATALRATPSPRRVSPLLAALAAIVIVALAVILLPIPWDRIIPTGGSPEKGIAALQGGDWEGVVRYLSRLDPSDVASVSRVAALFDEEMVRVPGGTLQMGSEDSYASDQRPVHRVAVTGFEMDRFEVTNLQYQWFVNETGSRPPQHWKSGRFSRGAALKPVVGVTWGDALEYARWRSKRLPSEPEWEWAARGPEGRLYPWGDESASDRANTKDVELGGTTDVGSMPDGATPLGIMGLVGNVREWTADRYGPYVDPHSPPGEGNEIAIRGGSWQTYGDVVTARNKAAPDLAAADLGFRCVR